MAATAGRRPRNVRAHATALLLVLTAVLTACAPLSSGSKAPAGASDDTPKFNRAGWKTDFSKHSVPLGEIMSGGPPRDGIPPIDHPKFESGPKAGAWLNPMEPVISFSVGSDHRAYPLQILIWHEITNDQVGGVPVVVTFCPLCNTAIALDRRVDGRTLDFGTTGNLRRSDLVMWDRQTESWWQQITGDAIVGELTGKRLSLLPAPIVSWAEFRRDFPDGRVLSRDTGFNRDYGRNPYVGYDAVGQRPFLYNGPLDGRLQAMERVVSVSLGGEDVAYPFSVLRQRLAVADQVGGQAVVIFFQPGTRSALDDRNISDSRDVGAATVFRSEVDGRRLTFSVSNGSFVDAQTGSRWSLLGQATAGPLAGKQLEPVVSGNHFWFAWAGFKPKTRIFQ